MAVAREQAKVIATGAWDAAVGEEPAPARVKIERSYAHEGAAVYLCRVTCGELSLEQWDGCEWITSRLAVRISERSATVYVIPSEDSDLFDADSVVAHVPRGDLDVEGVLRVAGILEERRVGNG